MSDQMTPEKATALRKPFAPESIGKLPKGGQMLDFVGHAAVVDRLLAVDPLWSWEPFAVDDHGLPALDRAGNLWIRLTVCGVTRIGVGDGKNAKEVVSDALRNAAMRFGVALDLWAKENLVEFAQAVVTHQRQAQEPPPLSPVARVMSEPPTAALLDPQGALAKRMFAMLGEAKITDRDARLKYVSETIGIPVASSSNMTDADAVRVIKRLESQAVAS